MAGSAVLTSKNDPAEKRKAVSGGRIAAALTFLVGVIFTGLSSHDGGYTPSIEITGAIVTLLGTAVSGFATHFAVWFAKNETPAEKQALAEAIQVLKLLGVSLPTVGALVGAAAARIEPTVQVKTVEVAGPETVKEVVKEVPLSVDLKALLSEVTEAAGPTLADKVGDIVDSYVRPATKA